MFIKNYSDSDFVIKYKGGEKTLEARDVTYVDDSWISYPMIKAMFGDYVGLVEGDTPIEEFLFDNQILAIPSKIYHIAGKGPGDARIFIKGGVASFYFADLKPETINDMYLSQAFTEVTGLITLNTLTNYIAVQCDDDVKVVFTNIKVLEQEV